MTTYTPEAIAAALRDAGVPGGQRVAVLAALVAQGQPAASQGQGEALTAAHAALRALVAAAEAMPQDGAHEDAIEELDASLTAARVCLEVGR